MTALLCRLVGHRRVYQVSHAGIGIWCTRCKRGLRL